MGRRLKILLVDEGPRGTVFFRKILSENGYAVDVYSDPEKVLGKLRVKKYDMIILDSSVSQGNGLSVLKRIHSEHPDERVIVMSSSPSWREGKEAYSGGAIDYVSKSFDEHSLLGIVRGDLGKVRV